MPYKYCRFCRGGGCIACPTEEKRDKANREAEPELPLLLSVNPENPDDMELLVRVFHREKLEYAFEEGVGPDETARTGRGGGMQTIEREAILARLLQIIRAED